MQGRQGLNLGHLIMMAFGTIVGVGWIVMLGKWLALAGSVGSVLAFLGGVIVIALVVFSYAELAAMFPATGGEMIYAYESFGPNAAFWIGWLLVLIYLGVAAFEAISLGWVLSQLVPWIEGPVIYSFLGESVRLGSLLVGLGVMAIITYANCSGVRTTAALQNLLTYILITLTVVFVIAGIWRGNPENLQPYFAEQSDSTGIWPGIAAVLLTAPFWYAGFSVVPQALGERSDDTPPTSAGLAMMIAVIAGFIFYALVILATSMAAPRSVVLDAALPAAAAFEAAFASPFMTKVVLLAGVFGLLTTWNPIFFAASRLLFALSRAHFLPGQLGHVSARRGSPVVAILAVAFIAGLATLAGRGAITPIANLSGAVFSLVYVAVTIMVIYLRLAKPDMSRPYRIPGGLLIPILGGLGAFALLCLALTELGRSSTAAVAPELVVVLFWLAAGFFIKSASTRRAPRMDPEAQRRLLLAALGDR